MKETNNLLYMAATERILRRLRSIRLFILPKDFSAKSMCLHIRKDSAGPLAKLLTDAIQVAPASSFLMSSRRIIASLPDFLDFLICGDL
jgi:hypothetical protein